MFDWDDLRYFLAVARAGSTLQAATRLGSSQPTVVRRIAALEAATGLKLFDRGRAGYALTDAGRFIVPVAERAEAEMQAVEDAVANRCEAGSGRIRLTMPDSLDAFLLPLLQPYHEAWPQVQVQILASFHRLELGRGEADMAIRVGEKPDSELLLVRQMPSVGWTFYASRHYAASAPLPESPASLSRHPVIAGEGAITAIPAIRWLERVAKDAPVVLRCNSLAAVQSAVRAGIGISLLPCIIGELDRDLVRCFEPVSELTTTVWLATRRELGRRPHVRALLDEITRQLEAHAGMLTGAVAASDRTVDPPIPVQAIRPRR